MRPEQTGDWRIEVTDLHGLDEVIDTPTRTILIDPKRHGLDWMEAHALSHVEWGHHLSPSGGSFTAAQEAEADVLADIRLGSTRTP